MIVRSFFLTGENDSLQQLQAKDYLKKKTFSKKELLAR